MSTVGMDLSTIFGRGGIQTYAWELLKHLAPIPDRPDLLILTRKRRIAEIEAAVGSTTGIAIEGAMPHPLALGQALRPVVQAYKSVVWKRYQEMVDLVHFHEVAIQRPTTALQVTTVHDLFPMQPEIPVDQSLRTSWGDMAERVVNAAARVIVPSEYTKGIIGDFFPDALDRVRVTPLAASDRFLPSPLARPIPEPYLVWIGRLDPRKNLKRLLQAWSQIPESLRSTYRLVLIGSWSREEVQRQDPELANLLDLDGVVTKSHITEEEHRQFLTHADALVFPSIAEGFGLPAIEAMKCGAPVLTSNTTSLPEVVGDAAILVDPASVQQIQEGMERLMTDAALRDELRGRGLRQAELFTWERTARQTLDVYREVLA